MLSTEESSEPGRLGGIWSDVGVLIQESNDTVVWAVSPACDRQGGHTG